MGEIENGCDCHTTAVKQLIVAYGLTDPVVDDSVGAFTDPVFAALSDELVATGWISLYDAYQVGLDIEVLAVSM
jgi:hypothetical protein